MERNTAGGQLRRFPAKKEFHCLSACFKSLDVVKIGHN
jgi:hypothetical protein